jgi:hypothetical protein
MVSGDVPAHSVVVGVPVAAARFDDSTFNTAGVPADRRIS